MLEKEEKRHEPVFESLFMEGEMGRSTLCFWGWLRALESPPGCATTPRECSEHSALGDLCELPPVFSSSFLCAQGCLSLPWELRGVQAVLQSWLWGCSGARAGRGEQGWG